MLSSIIEKSFSQNRIKFFNQQKIVLRKMNTFGRVETPVISSETILNLFNTLGRVEISISDLVFDFYKQLENGGNIDNIFEYATANDYKVLFKTGDIVKNKMYSNA